MKRTLPVLLTTLALAAAPHAAADEIDVELDIIEDLESLDAWELNIELVEVDEPTDRPADESDEPREDVARVELQEDTIDELDRLHDEQEAFDGTDEMDMSNVDDLKGDMPEDEMPEDEHDGMDKVSDEMIEDDIAEESMTDDVTEDEIVEDELVLDDSMEESIDEPTDEPMQEPIDESVDEPVADGTDDVDGDRV